MHWIRWGTAIALVVGACTDDQRDPVDPVLDTTSTEGTVTGGTDAGSSTGTASSGGSHATGGTVTTGGVSTAGTGATGGAATGGVGAAGAGGSGPTSGGGGEAAGNAGGTAGIAPRLPEANAAFDYQLGGSYTPPAGVRIVTRDREDSPAPGLYNICYVNGFQTQPQDNAEWLRDRAE